MTGDSIFSKGIREAFLMRWHWSQYLLKVDERKVFQAEQKASAKALRPVVFEEVRMAKRSVLLEQKCDKRWIRGRIGFYSEQNRWPLVGLEQSNN